MSGMRSTATKSAWSLSTISFGVPAGTSAPIQETASKPGMPASATVGKLGSEAERWALVTAMGLSAPALICGITATMLSNMSWMRPLIRSV